MKKIIKLNKVFEYNPQLYPTKFWVVFSETTELSYLDEHFYLVSSDMEMLVPFKEHLERNPLSVDGCVVATTFVVRSKDKNEQGCMVLVVDSKRLDGGVFAHEASHCTDYVLEQIGMSTFSFSDGEPRAYLLQWFFERLEEATKEQKQLKREYTNNG